MYNTTLLLCYNEELNEYKFTDRDNSYLNKKQTKDYASVHIVDDGVNLTSLEFGYYLCSNFYKCPVWSGSILFHSFLIKGEDYFLVIGFAPNNPQQIQIHEVKISSGVKSKSEILKYLASVMSFISRYFNSSQQNSLFMTTEVNMTDIPFEYDKTDLFFELSQIKFKLEYWEIVGDLKRQAVITLSNIAKSRFFIYSTIIKILYSRLNNSIFLQIENDGVIKIKWIVSNVEYKLFENYCLSNSNLVSDNEIAKFVQHIIFYNSSFQFDKNVFISNYIEYENVSNEYRFKSRLDLLIAEEEFARLLV